MKIEDWKQKICQFFTRSRRFIGGKYGFTLNFLETLGYVYPVVALNLALIFTNPLAIKGRLLIQCHLLD